MADMSITPAPPRTVVIGVYGLPASGKTSFLEYCKRQTDLSEFIFFEGSKIIASLTSGGINAFNTMSHNTKTGKRETATVSIKDQCISRNKAGVVSGHYSFWNESGNREVAWTEADAEVFTHIIYLKCGAEVLQKRIANDNKIRPNRSSASDSHLSLWQSMEMDDLRIKCREHNILFTVFETDSQVGDSMPFCRISELLKKFRSHDEVFNAFIVKRKVDEAVAMYTKKPDSILVFDADKTLTDADTGALFFGNTRSTIREAANPTSDPTGEKETLEAIFSSPLGYSCTAFCQVALLYDKTDDETFDARCSDVASGVHLYPKIHNLLQLVKRQKVCGTVGAVIVTCGLRLTWEKILQREGLSDVVKVIGLGRSAESEYVVTPETKADVVRRLRDHHNTYVWAFGDSPLDIPMMRCAHEAVVVVGDTDTRSKSMEGALEREIDEGTIQPRQTFVQTPRLNLKKLPAVDIDRLSIEQALNGRLQVVIADQEPADLLATAMRDATLQGPRLQEAHRKSGEYLAIHHVTKLIGMQYYSIPHARGNQPTDGYRVYNEEKTLIVPLMRGGLPMAEGVLNVLPLAMFLHAKVPEDISVSHLSDCCTVILVDAVVNSGESIISFVKYVREKRSTVRIIVVTGVTPAATVGCGGPLEKGLEGFGEVTLVTLRTSQNSYKGVGSSDTGARLFNTVQLET